MKITFTSPYSFTVDGQEYFGRPKVTYDDTMKQEEPIDPLGQDDWWDLGWDTFHIMIGVNTGDVWFICWSRGLDGNAEDDEVTIENRKWLDFYKKTFHKKMPES